MRKLSFTLYILLSFQIINGQLLDFEHQIIAEYEKEKSNQNQARNVIGDISGFCDVITTVTNQNEGIGWDDCEGNSYEGVIEFERYTSELYNVFSTNSYGEWLNDLSFGAFNACYGTESQENLPNDDADNPSLYFSVNESGGLKFSGFSQWSEVYTLSNIVMDGAELSFDWISDYGEGANVQLTRQDGQNWLDIINPCTFETDSDSLALVALYNSTNGPNWNVAWDLNTPVRNWHGIIIDQDICRVTEIDLGSSYELSLQGFEGINLTGVVPDEIGELSELTHLDLDDNQLEGEILPKVTNLTNLRSLVLSDNMFTGTIPSELSNLENLELLSLSLNNFEGELPVELGTLTNLRFLFATVNNLSGEIPVEFGQLQSLESFTMQFNSLTGNIPEELGNISSLKILNLGYNNLSGEIPSSLGQIPNLYNLILPFNQLSGTMPKGFNSMRLLQLNDNMLSGSFPESFAVFDMIFEINLSNNNFTGEIPDRFFDQTPVQALFFANNDFSGCVENIDELCTKTYDPDLDTLMVGGQMYISNLGIGYNLTGNPKLAWKGDFQNACAGEDQIGALCDDGDPNSFDDVITEDCECLGKPVSTNDIDELNSITISPNPFIPGDILNINLDLNQNINAKLLIIDTNGSVKTSKSLESIIGSNTFSLNTNNLSKGLYVLQLVSENGVVSKKIVVQ